MKEINLTPNQNSTFEVDLDGVRHKLTFKYNSRAARWMASLELNGVVLQQGVPAVVGAELFQGDAAPNIPRGLFLIPVDEAAKDADFAGLGQRVKLVHYEKGDVFPDLDTRPELLGVAVVLTPPPVVEPPVVVPPTLDTFNDIFAAETGEQRIGGYWTIVATDGAYQDLAKSIPAKNNDEDVMVISQIAADVSGGDLIVMAEATDPMEYRTDVPSGMHPQALPVPEEPVVFYSFDKLLQTGYFDKVITPAFAGGAGDALFFVEADRVTKTTGTTGGGIALLRPVTTQEEVHVATFTFEQWNTNIANIVMIKPPTGKTAEEVLNTADFTDTVLIGLGQGSATIVQSFPTANSVGNGTEGIITNGSVVAVVLDMPNNRVGLYRDGTLINTMTFTDTTSTEGWTLAMIVTASALNDGDNVKYTGQYSGQPEIVSAGQGGFPAGVSWGNNETTQLSPYSWEINPPAGFIGFLSTTIYLGIILPAIEGAQDLSQIPAGFPTPNQGINIMTIRSTVFEDGTSATGYKATQEQFFNGVLTSPAGAPADYTPDEQINVGSALGLIGLPYFAVQQQLLHHKLHSQIEIDAIVARMLTQVTV